MAVPKGNINAQKYSDDDLEKIAATIIKHSKSEVSIVGIVYHLEISQRNYYDLVERYQVVSDAHDLAKIAVARLAWQRSYDEKGYPNVLTMAIRNHDEGTNSCTQKNLKEEEQIKSDIRIKERKALLELGDTVADGAVLTPAQALLMKSLIEDKVKEKVAKEVPIRKPKPKKKPKPISNPKKKLKKKEEEIGVDG